MKEMEEKAYSLMEVSSKRTGSLYLLYRNSPHSLGYKRKHNSK